MSVKVIIRRCVFIESGREVKIGEECRIPEGLALSMERKGMCEIVRPKPPSKPAEPAPVKKAAPKNKATKKKAAAKKTTK